MFSEFNLVYALGEEARQITNEAISEDNTHTVQKEYKTSTNELNLLSAIKDSIMYYGKRFKPKFIGYKIKHIFRESTGYREKEINTVEFYFDKNLTKVDSTRTLN